MVDDAYRDEGRDVGEAKFVVNDKIGQWKHRCRFGGTDIFIDTDIVIVVFLSCWSRQGEILSEDRQEGRND